MGVDLYDMFAAMVADRHWDEMMNEEKKHDFKKRLEVRYDDAAKAERYKVIREKHQLINNCLAEMDSELLILFKTNDYLRAIDKRLGNPTNTFNIINEVSWKVYKKELCRDMTYKRYMWEILKFYMMKFWIFLAQVSGRCRSLLGIKQDEE